MSPERVRAAVVKCLWPLSVLTDLWLWSSAGTCARVKLDDRETASLGVAS